ncbi:hypothetical protein FH972_014324 [Carpinus fangiana]|uniref:Uncharacterized protein n=1 Tax=Carpinus fangiana TaxID=176857 RepID=A0A5N6RC34_9ROSI|nr:hypothetical protein FH972_014324 [Carpinus fangiana]
MCATVTFEHVEFNSSPTPSIPSLPPQSSSSTVRFYRALLLRQPSPCALRSARSSAPSTPPAPSSSSAVSAAERSPPSTSRPILVPIRSPCSPIARRGSRSHCT